LSEPVYELPQPLSPHTSGLSLSEGGAKDPRARPESNHSDIHEEGTWVVRVHEDEPAASQTGDIGAFNVEALQQQLEAAALGDEYAPYTYNDDASSADEGFPINNEDSSDEEPPRAFYRGSEHTRLSDEARPPPFFGPGDVSADEDDEEDEPDIAVDNIEQDLDQININEDSRLDEAGSASASPGPTAYEALITRFHDAYLPMRSHFSCSCSMIT
jgi:hypothetical protein